MTDLERNYLILQQKARISPRADRLPLWVFAHISQRNGHVSQRNGHVRFAPKADNQQTKATAVARAELIKPSNHYIVISSR
jgi:hypothetical protein